MRELLQEAAEVLRRGQRDEQADLAERIDAALAEPLDSAIEDLIDEIRDNDHMPDTDSGDFNFTLSYKEAAALIASLGRRVPRAMLEELAIEILNLADLTWKSGWQEYVKNLLTAIFAKHGVQVEG